MQHASFPLFNKYSSIVYYYCEYSSIYSCCYTKMQCIEMHAPQT